MKYSFKYLLWVGFLVLVNLSLVLAQTPQVRYGVRTHPTDPTLYQVYMVMSGVNSLTGNNARIPSAQVTLRFPAGFTVSNVQGRQGVNFDNQPERMIWTYSSGRVVSPRICADGNSWDTGCMSGTVLSPYTYISFNFNQVSSPVRFDIPAGQELELFTFTKPASCPGDVSLFDNATDPFRTPNSVNTNPGNQMTIQVAGLMNTYVGNLSAVAPCVAGSPDLSIALSGPATLTAGSGGSYTLSVRNATGAGATTGVTSLTFALPVGLTYAGFSGSGWSIATSQAGGQAYYTATYPATLAAGASAPPLELNVQVPAGTTPGLVNLTGSVSTFGESAVGNNNFSQSISLWAPTSPAANLSTNILVLNSAPNPQEAVTAQIIVTNSGPATATGVVGQVTLPVGNPITGTVVTQGAFSSSTGQWQVGTLTAGQSVTLTLTFSALTGGVATIAHEIMASPVFDPNSTPGNHLPGEDDQASACFSVPLDLCAGQAIQLSIPSQAGAVQWRRNGQPIPGATATTVTITQGGAYTVDAGIPCGSGSCCPVIVREVTNCCTNSVCIPLTVRRIR